jgi:hypothetical protein
MNSDGVAASMDLGDLVALKIQEWHATAKLQGDQPLLRIDNREEVGDAPFQFDAASGRLHRRGCRALAAPSRRPVYGVWQVGLHEWKLACGQCKPVAEDEKTQDRSGAADLLFGFVSIIAQFGGVLRERGREYRQSSPGRVLNQQIETLYEGLGRRERDIVDTVLVSLDGLVTKIRDLDRGLNGANGMNGMNGKNGTNGMNGHGGTQGNGHDATRAAEDENGG